MRRRWMSMSVVMSEGGIEGKGPSPPGPRPATYLAPGVAVRYSVPSLR